MAEAAGGGGGGSESVSLTKESFETALTDEVKRMIGKKVFEPQKLFVDYMPQIVNPTKAMQPLIVPLFDKLPSSFPQIGYHQQGLTMNKTKGPIARVAVTSINLDENAELAASPNNVSLEPAVFNKTAYGENTPNTVNIFDPGKKGFVEIKPKLPLYYNSKIPIVIQKEVKDAVSYIFSSTAPSEKKQNIENYPIYFIAAWPGNERHLTLIVYYDSTMYSCGIAGTTNYLDVLAPMVSGAATGAPAAFSMQPSGVGVSMAAASGAVYTKFKSGTAMLLSPDYLYSGGHSRVFHMGILMPEHLTSLETYIGKIIDVPILNFRKITAYDAQLVGYKFKLKVPFDLIALPGTNTTNCTRFILDIFGSKIACPSSVLGPLLPDPSQCVIKNLSKILESHKTRETEFKKVLEGLSPSGWLRTFVGKPTDADYTARDAYITYLLARFIKAYRFNRQDPDLINDLKDPLAAEAEAAGGGGGGASMSVEGGVRRKRHASKRKTKARRKRRSTKRRSNI